MNPALETKLHWQLVLHLEFVDHEPRKQLRIEVGRFLRHVVPFLHDTRHLGWCDRTQIERGIDVVADGHHFIALLQRVRVQEIRLVVDRFLRETCALLE